MLMRTARKHNFSREPNLCVAHRYTAPLAAGRGVPVSSRNTQDGEMYDNSSTSIRNEL